MSHPFGDLVQQHLHRKHGLSQAKLAAGILQEPAMITRMCKGQRLTGPQARERVLLVVGWLHLQGVLGQVDEANALLTAAGLAALRNGEPSETTLLRQLRPKSHPATSTPAVTPTIAPSYPLIGRAQEWHKLRVSWQQAMNNAAHFACIEGEAGIGKTRLAEELLVAAQREGCAIARTRAYALEGRLAYGPLADWLRSPALASSVRQLAAVWRTELARLLPELLIEDEALPTPRPMTDRWQRKQLFEALLNAITGMQQPLLLAVDDLQWCDPETLEWLQYLFGAASRSQLLVIGTVREDELETRHPLHAMRQHLLRDGQLTRIPLKSLGEADNTSLGEVVAQHNLDVTAAQQLFHECAGNPLFVIETLRTRDVTTNDTATSSTVAAIPPKIYGVIAARLNQLSPQARTLVDVAAVIGHAFNLVLLAQASGQDEATATSALDELWQHQLLREDALGMAHYDFGHDRIRDVASAEISPPRLQTLHRQVAQALASIHADNLDSICGELAEHFLQAGVLDQALTYFRQAATHAKRLYAHSEVVRYLDKAIAVVQLKPDHAEFRSTAIDLWYELGFARIMTFYWGAEPVRQAWLQSLASANQYGTTAQQGRALFIMGVVSSNAGRWREAREWSERALPVVAQSDDIALSGHMHSLYGISLYHFGEFERSQDYLFRCLEIASRAQAASNVWSSDEHPRYGVTRLAKCLWMLGWVDQARSYAVEAVELALTCENFGWETYDFICMFRIYIGDLDGVAELAEQLISFGTKYDNLFYYRAGQMYRGWVMAQHGQVSEGMTLIRNAVDGHRESGARMFEPFWRGLLVEALALAGQTGQALDEVDRVLAFADECGNTYWNAHLLKLKGDLLQRRSGSPTTAEPWYQQALNLSQMQGAKTLELRSATALARLWLGQGKRAKAYALLAPIYGWFTEGFDTTDLVEAKLLLNQLA